MKIMIRFSDAEALLNIVAKIAKRERGGHDRLPCFSSHLDRKTKEAQQLGGQKEEVFVPIEFQSAKEICALLNDFLLSHPYEKDNFFKALVFLEEEVKRAEEAMSNDEN